jgi:hypothetical protein
MAKKFFDISVAKTKEGPRLKLVDRFSKGIGVSNNNNSALVRPYKRFLNDRTDIGSVKYIFHRDNNRYYVLCSVVYTKGKRILLFPGDIGRTVVRTPGKPIRKKTKQNTSEYIDQTLDHLTVEENLQSWHIKLLDRNIWYKGQRTKRINNSLFFWFQWQLRSLNDIEPVPEKQIQEIIQLLLLIQRRLSENHFFGLSNFI